MDPRRYLIIATLGLALGGCAQLSAFGIRPTIAPAANALGASSLTAAELGAAPATADMGPAVATTAPVADTTGPARDFATMSPIPNPGGRMRRARPLVPLSFLRQAERAPATTAGPAAIAAANRQARETSRAQGFLGGVQVFGYESGRVYEVWTAPLRVTTLTLSPGETVVSKAAGDTVRWQIGETESGEGPSRRAHVMVKPLERGLETNLVLATSRRVYLIELKSGAPAAFNAAVTWDLDGLLSDVAAASAPAAPPTPSVALVSPQGPLDARFRIKVKGRRPAWTPSAVMTDGARTFLTFPAGLIATEAPALFAVSPAGETQMVNYRQQGGLWIVDRVLDTAELRVGSRNAAVVRIEREEAAS